MELLEYYHCAKLSLFNVRLLHDLEESRASDPAVEQIIHRRAKNDQVAEPISLMHQSTFLGHAFIILVWMNEYVYKKFKNSEKKKFKKAFSIRFNIETDTEMRSSELLASEDSNGESPRDLSKREEFFRTMRNALAHARVDIVEGYFVFDNTSDYDRATIKMTWAQLGKLTDAMLFAYTDVLYAGKSSK